MDYDGDETFTLQDMSTFGGCKLQLKSVVVFFEATGSLLLRDGDGQYILYCNEYVCNFSSLPPPHSLLIHD